MAFVQDISHCLAAKIGGAGLTDAELAAAIGRAEPALMRLRKQHDDGSLPLLRLPARRDDLAAARAAARQLAGFETIVVLGTGGSSLGGQVLAACAGAAGQKLVFMDNIDPDTFVPWIEAAKAGSVGFLAISKSGKTAETLSQFLIAREAVLRALGEAELKRRFVVITEPGRRPLRDLAAAAGMTILDHDPKVGGRYAVLSNVGMLPALLLGLDPEEIRAGAALSLSAILAKHHANDCPPALGAAVAFALANKGASISVLMPYSDPLRFFALWYCQLWAESLGKQGHGTTPVAAVGAVDQHSQLQLYLDGPKDKFFTLMQLHRAGTGPRIGGPGGDGEIGVLLGRTLGDLMEAEQRATYETMARHGRPVRLFRLAQLDARTLGALLMHFMLETIIAGYMLGVDPFDQPAVEEGKHLARKYLSEM
ncbi:MAG: glucose-6-phosphate isomerase [Alphaproteobacteria bacterium]